MNITEPEMNRLAAQQAYTNLRLQELLAASEQHAQKMAERVAELEQQLGEKADLEQRLQEALACADRLETMLTTSVRERDALRRQLQPELVTDPQLIEQVISDTVES